MRRLLLNAAMVPNDGTFTYCRISRDRAANWLAEHGHEAVSYIGYQQTAEHLRSLAAVCGEPLAVPLSRARCAMQPGDEALVCKLAYRVSDPASKGQPQTEDWEYGILRCVDLEAALEAAIGAAIQDGLAPACARGPATAFWSALGAA